MSKKLPFEGVYLYQRASGSFYVQFRRRGSRYKKTITLKARTEALAFAEAVELGRLYEAGLFDPFTERTESITLTDAVRRWVEHDASLSQHTIRERRITLERFARGLPRSFEPRDVTARHVEAFVHDRSLKPSTAQGYYSKVRAFFNWLKSEGYVRESPMGEVAEPKVKRRSPVYLSKEQARTLIEAAEADVLLKEAPVWMPDLIRVAIGTGFRRAELCALRWRDVDLESSRVYTRPYVRRVGGKVVFEHRTKSGHDRAVPLLPVAREVLERLHAERANEDEDETVFLSRGEPLRGNFVGQTFRRQRERAGLPERFTFHTLRHTFAAWLATEGVPLRHIQEYLGHASIQTTLVYSHLVEDEAHAIAMRAMSPL